MGVIPPGEVEKPFVIFFFSFFSLAFPLISFIVPLPFLSVAGPNPAISLDSLFLLTIVEHLFPLSFFFFFGFFTHFLLPHIIIVSP